MKKHYDPFWWSLFGAGGAASALIMPALLFFIGIAIPLGWVSVPSHEKIKALSDSIVSRVVIWGVVSLSLFHWAHRFRFTLYDGLQLKRWDTLISFLCYGTATVVTFLSAYLLLIK